MRNNQKSLSKKTEESKERYNKDHIRIGQREPKATIINRAHTNKEKRIERITRLKVRSTLIIKERTITKQ